MEELQTQINALIARVNKQDEDIIRLHDRINELETNIADNYRGIKRLEYSSGSNN